MVTIETIVNCERCERRLGEKWQEGTVEVNTETGWCRITCYTCQHTKTVASHNTQ